MGGKGSGRTGASDHDSSGRWAGTVSSSSSSSGCGSIFLCMIFVGALLSVLA